MRRYITYTVLLLSFVSLFADIASEMLYPVMPAFLESIGFGALGLGMLEGVARLVTGFGKVWFGSLSDQLGQRVIFIRGGYLLSAIAKPLMGLFPYVFPVLGARIVDRLGKGMRGAARDAVLVGESSPEDRGKVFGFHRALDTLGAVIGPLLAILWLHYYPGDLIGLFLLAFAPGMIGVLITLRLPADTQKPVSTAKINPIAGALRYFREASPGYKRLLLGFSLFAILNSTDLLLILRASETGLSGQEVIFAYLIYNVVYAIMSFPLGSLGDKIGFRTVYLASILVFGLCYFALGLVTENWMTYSIFALYGCFTAANESIAKSWISLHLPADKKATGLGLYSFLHTLSLFIASPLIELIWALSSGETPFCNIGIAAGLVFILLIFILPRNPSHEAP